MNLDEILRDVQGMNARLAELAENLCILESETDALLKSAKEIQQGTAEILAEVRTCS